MLSLVIRETGFSGNLDIREKKKGGPLDSLIQVRLYSQIWISWKFKYVHTYPTWS
jgi:hypothetical protein